MRTATLLVVLAFAPCLFADSAPPDKKDDVKMPENAR